MQELLAIIKPTIQLSVVLLVLAIGLSTSWDDVLYLFRNPALLARSVLARNVIVPGVTLLLVVSFDIDRPVAAALLALSIACVPPILPRSLLKAGGREPYVIGLLASQSVLAILFVPLSLAVFNALLGLQTHFSPLQAAPIIALLTLLPLALGATIGHFAPRFAERAAGKISRAGTILLIVGLVAIIGMSFRAWITLIGNGTLAVMALVVVLGLAAGHLLGGPREDDRTSLALVATSCHPALALAILSTNSVLQLQLSIAAVFLYLVVRAVMTRPYVKYREREKYGPLYRIAERRHELRPGPDRRRMVS